MNRFAALALAGLIPLTAVAGNPVSVYPPAPPKPANSMSQPLSAAVQSAAATLPAPAPVMTSTPSWGAPAVLPGTLVGSPCATAAAPCGEPATCTTVKPYFNVLAPRGGCDVVRGSCLDRLKDWFNFRSSPGGFGFTPTPYHAPLRAYFPCPPTAGCATGGCVTAGGSCGTVTLPVQRLSAGCDTPACRPRVMYQPLSTRSEVPVLGCDARPMRPRLFERLFGFFGPKWGGMCGDGACTPDTYTPPLTATATVWSSPSSPAVVPNAMPGTFVPPLSTTPIYGPVSKPGNGRPIQLSPAQPFTNP